MNLSLKINAEKLSKLKNLQALLGCKDIRETANLLVSLGALVVNEAVKGGQIGIVNEEKNEWNPVSHPALDHIRQIISEQRDL